MTDMNNRWKKFFSQLVTVFLITNFLIYMYQAIRLINNESEQNRMCLFIAIGSLALILLVVKSKLESQ
jgi:ABC-type spermidine/putrescine transport system permease subunit I